MAGHDDAKDLGYEDRVEHVSTSSDEKLPHGAVPHDDTAIQDWTPEEERKIVSAKFYAHDLAPAKCFTDGRSTGMSFRCSALSSDYLYLTGATSHQRTLQAWMSLLS